MKKNAGFTLVELMIAIAVIGIMVGLVAPNFNVWSENENFISSVEDVRGILQRAKMAAINDRCNVIVKFSDSGSSGTYHAFVDDDGGTPEVYDDGETEVIPECAIPGNGELSNVAFDGILDNTTRFNSMGISIGYAGILTLKNENLETSFRRIVISTAGNIKMEKSADGNVWYY